MTETSQEQKLRRIANRRNLRLTKSSSRDPRAATYGRWWITDTYAGALVLGGVSGATTEEVEAFLGEDA